MVVFCFLQIQDFHATFLNLTRKVVNVTPRVSPSPAPTLMNIKLTLCVVFIAILLVCVTCALVAVRKNKNKNRCMKLRRKSGQYYVKVDNQINLDVNSTYHVCNWIIHRNTCILLFLLWPDLDSMLLIDRIVQKVSNVNNEYVKECEYYDLLKKRNIFSCSGKRRWNATSVKELGT